MRYTDTEKQKIIENLDKIVEYIKTEICPNLREPVCVDVTPLNSITVCPVEEYNKTISGRTGNNLTINFENENTKGLYYSSSSVYSLDSVVIARYAIDLILNWKYIKAELLDEIAAQQSIIDSINNFEI